MPTEQSYNLKYTGAEIDALLDKANDMNANAVVPTGGSSGQVLTKNSSTDFDATWKTPAASHDIPAGGTTGQVLAKKSNASYDLNWVDQTGGGSSAQSALKVTDLWTNSSPTATFISQTVTLSDVPTNHNLLGIEYAVKDSLDSYSYVRQQALFDMSKMTGSSTNGAMSPALRIFENQGVRNITLYKDSVYLRFSSAGNLANDTTDNNACIPTRIFALDFTGSGGESDLFVIKVTGASYSDFAADKTYDEMLAAYQAGKAVIMVPKDITIDTSAYLTRLRCLPLSRIYSTASTSSSTGITTTREYAVFASSDIGVSLGVAHGMMTSTYITWTRTSTSDGTVSESFSINTSSVYTIPYGGKTGQLLAKKDNDSFSFNVQWIDPPSDGGGSGAGLTKTALWVSSSQSPTSQNATDLTLNDNINNYKIVYAVFASTGGSPITGMQFLNLDKPYMGTYSWNLFAENGNSRVMRLVNDTSIHIYDGENGQGSTDATACVVTGIYGIN